MAANPYVQGWREWDERYADLVLGKRTDLTARQDPLLPPGRLRVDQAEAVIVFRRENQACAEWGVAASHRCG